jgi:hypothetical protein
MNRESVATSCSNTARWVAAWSHRTDPKRVDVKRRNWRSEFGRCDDGPGWRVGWNADGKLWFIPLNFASLRDAERAAKSINDIREWGPTVEDVAYQAIEFGLGQLRETMIRDLFW